MELKKINFELKDLKPTKWFIFKSFVRLTVAISICTIYVNTINNQIKIDDFKRMSVSEIVEQVYESEKQTFLDLLKKAEGFSKFFYPDNKGIAIGYGYNPSQNDLNYNKNILDYAGVSKENQKKILENSEKFKNTELHKVPEIMKDIKLTQEQIDKMAVFSKQSYESDFKTVLIHKIDKKNYSQTHKNNLLNVYKNLPENQKSVLIHMTYKVGQQGLERYNNFFNNFIAYLENPTIENKKNVANGFIYKYKKNGHMLNDTRVSKIHYDLFMKNISSKEQKESHIIKHKEEKNLTKEEKFIIAKKEIDEQISFSGLVKYFKNKAKEKNIHNSVSIPLYNNTIENNEDNEFYYEDNNDEVVESHTTSYHKKFRY